MHNNNFFIIEFLRIEDENELDWYEGKQLAEYLNKLSKHSAQYYYIRTKIELEEMASLFTKSSFTNLFVSCHGDCKNLYLAFDKFISFKQFSSIFDGKLNRKRVFFSSCEVGTQELADALYRKNPTIYSIMAPSRKVSFKEIFPYWITLFHRIEENMSAEIEEKKKRGTNYKINRNSLLYDAYKTCSILGTDVNLWLKRNYTMQKQEIEQGNYDDEYDN